MGFPFGLGKAKPKRPVFGSRFFYSVELHKKELHNASTGNPRFRIKIQIWYTKKTYICNIKLNHMKTVSLKIDDSIFGETEKILSSLKTSRNRYINEAIEYYNKFQKRNFLEKKLKLESNLVQKDSMTVLKDFENLGYED